MKSVLFHRLESAQQLQPEFSNLIKLQSIFPELRGLTRAVQQLVFKIRQKFHRASQKELFKPNAFAVKKVCESLRICLSNELSPHADLSDHELRFWHEIRLFAMCIGTNSSISGDRQRQIVKEYFTRIDEGDTTMIKTQYSPNVEYVRIVIRKNHDSLKLLPEQKTLRGRENVVNFFDNERCMEGEHFFIYRMSGAHGWVISEGSYNGKNTRTNAKISIPNWYDIVMFGKEGIEKRYSLIFQNE